MEITLKNGEKLQLEISPLILEYVEDYDGGIEKLLQDAEGEKDENGYTKSMYATNHLLYCIIASNYHSELTYRQAVRLVRIEDIEKIIKYTVKEVKKIEISEIPEITKSKHRI